MTEGPVHVRAEAPPRCAVPRPVTDAEIIEAYLDDASGSGPGKAAGLLRVETEEQAAAFLRATAGRGVPVLPQAARSSLTAGAIPGGETILSVERMAGIRAIQRAAEGARAVVGPGTRLRDLQGSLAAERLYYPPVPTYQEAMLGGTASTNAGGAATFKYGVTRDWIRALRLVLADGDVLAVERGQARVRPGESFRIERSDGSVTEVPAPSYRLPPVRKISAGYYASDPLDLVDLFVGSEGTLALITEVTVDLVALAPGLVTGLAFLPSFSAALDLAGALRDAAHRARSAGDRRGPDVRAIESLDENCLDLLRRYGDSRRLRIQVPEVARAAVLFEMELPAPSTNDQAQDLLASFLEDRETPDVPLVRLFRILADHDAVENLEFAFPEDTARGEALREFREAAPTRVNEILAERRRENPAVHKVGGDLIVPFQHLPEMVERYREGFERRGLEFAIWGHLSDGNLHPNVLPRTAEDVRLGTEALLEFGDEAARLGGSPLSEHGVGRSPLKQELLRRFLGDAALDQMRAVKRALDPEGRFAPGVLFPAPR